MLYAECYGPAANVATQCTKVILINHLHACHTITKQVWHKSMLKSTGFHTNFSALWQYACRTHMIIQSDITGAPLQLLKVNYTVNMQQSHIHHCVCMHHALYSWLHTVTHVCIYSSICMYVQQMEPCLSITCHPQPRLTDYQLSMHSYPLYIIIIQQ